MIFILDINQIIIFSLLQLLNIISSTIKSIVVIKCKNQFVAGLVNAINYAINYVVIKYTSFIDINLIIIVTIITNLVGVPLGRLIIDKLEKDQLWIYNATINCTELKASAIKANFKEEGIDVLYKEIIENARYSFEIFSYKKQDSVLIKELIEKYKGKYYIVETV